MFSSRFFDRMMQDPFQNTHVFEDPFFTHPTTTTNAPAKASTTAPAPTQTIQPQQQFPMWDDWSFFHPMQSLSFPEANSSSFHCSSSSFSQTGADGKPITRESRTERRRVGEAVEEQTTFKDSFGNTRVVTKKGLNKQLKECICDKNAKGEERKIENLNGIKPEESATFDQQWSAACEKYDPQHKLIGGASQARLTSGSGNCASGTCTGGVCADKNAAASDCGCDKSAKSAGSEVRTGRA